MIIKKNRIKIIDGKDGAKYQSCLPCYGRLSSVFSPFFLAVFH